MILKNIERMDVPLFVIHTYQKSKEICMWLGIDQKLKQACLRIKIQWLFDTKKDQAIIFHFI